MASAIGRNPPFQLRRSQRPKPSRETSDARCHDHQEKADPCAIIANHRSPHDEDRGHDRDGNPRAVCQACARAPAKAPGPAASTALPGPAICLPAEGIIGLYSHECIQSAVTDSQDAMRKRPSPSQIGDRISRESLALSHAPDRGGNSVRALQPTGAKPPLHSSA